jgi:hypothetical protein
MTAEQWQKLSPLPEETKDRMLEAVKGAYTLFALFSYPSPVGKDVVRIALGYEGDEELLYNSFVELFSTEDPIISTIDQAYLKALHNRTAEGYEKGEMMFAKQRKALFPREVLQPIFEAYDREFPDASAKGFFEYLLKQKEF